MKPSVLLIAIFLVIAVATSVFADDGPVPTAPATAPPTTAPALDVVTLRDGSVIYGEVIEMMDGVLQVKSALATEVIKVKWAEVSKLAVSHPFPSTLRKGPCWSGRQKRANREC